jgi:type VI secretion system secreted protein Hcp
MADRWFLKIDGVDGESTDASHKDEIDVLAWSWGLERPEDPGGSSGGGGGRATFEDFHFVAKISKASPKLFLAAAEGTHFKFAALSGAHASSKGKTADYLKYKLSDVLVTSVDHEASDTEAPVEQFSLAYSKFVISYSPPSPTGKIGPPITAGWDLQASKKL